MITNTIQGLNKLIKNRLIEKNGNVILTENTDIILYGKALGISENQLLFKILEIEETIDWAKEKENRINSDTFATVSNFTTPIAIIYCSNCNAANEDGVANFCVDCGTELRPEPITLQSQYYSQPDVEEKSKTPYIIGFSVLIVVAILVGVFFLSKNPKPIAPEIAPNEISDTTQVQDFNQKEIIFLNEPINTITDDDLINLFNVSLSDLGDEFIATSDSIVKNPIIEITSKQFFKLGERNLLLASLGITNPNDYHVSYGRLDIGFFEFSNTKWEKIDHLMNADGSGYGTYPNFKSFKLFGRNKLCAIFSEGDMHMGYEWNADIIFGLNNDKISQILSVTTFESSDDGNEKTEIKTKYDFIDNGEEFFTVKLVTKENGKMEKIKYFNFDITKSKFQ
jgi:hypothetical protein